MTIPVSWLNIDYKSAIEKISTNKIKIKQSEYLSQGKLPIIDQGQNYIGGYTNDNEKIINCNFPIIVFGDHTKVVKLIDFKFAPGADGVKLVRPLSFFNPKIFFYFTKYLAKIISDKGYARHFQYIEKEKIPLPPLKEQIRIVEKIEELFSDLDKATEDLKKTQKQLKIYWQAVLKAAFEGKLTNGNRNWIYKKFKECLKFSQGIQIDVYLQDEKKEQNKIRFLRIIDFTQGNEPARYINKPNSKYIVNKEDVSLVRYGATTGFVCSGLEGAIANNLFKVIPDETISKKYLLYFLNSPFFQQIISIKVKGAAMPAISFGLINDFVLPIPLLKEQSDIVREIELRLSVCDKLKETIEQSLKKMEYLRQSILKKAFEGKLVPQDPNDLPAGELLKQIKIEKDKMNKNGK